MHMKYRPCFSVRNYNTDYRKPDLRIRQIERDGLLKTDSFQYAESDSDVTGDCISDLGGHFGERFRNVRAKYSVRVMDRRAIRKIWKVFPPTLDAGKTALG